MTAQDTQPGEEEKKETAVQHINLKVVGPDQNEIAFKIKRTTPLQKLMDAYIQKTNLDKNSLRFLYEGERLKGDGTPDSYDMEDGDSIQIHVQQIGGF